MAGNIIFLARIGYAVLAAFNVHLGVTEAETTVPWDELPSAARETYLEQVRSLLANDRPARVPVSGASDEDGDVEVTGVGEALFDSAVLAAAQA